MNDNLKKASLEIVNQLIEFLQQLPDDIYTKPLLLLSNNTIGKHIRHIVEFYECVFTCSNSGMVNYDVRRRSIRLETDKIFCVGKLHYIATLICSVHTDEKLRLQMSYSAGEPVYIDSSISRELVYNMEHAIHHMAIIKMSIISINVPVALPHNFGVAFSTIQYKTSACSPDVNHK